MMKMNRRFFLQSTALAGTSLMAAKALGQVPFIVKAPGAAIPLINFPISETSTAQSLDFNGDDINRPHDILWDLSNYLKTKGGEPEIEERREWVVVGGGISGLLSAYYLKDQKPLLLEQAPQFGGNSKGEQFGQSRYSMGAAYVCIPEEGSDTENLFKEIGILDQARKEMDTKVFYKGQIRESFWEGSTDPDQKKSIQEFQKDLKKILAYRFPEIPASAISSLSRNEFNALDKISFEQWLKENFPNLSEHVKEYCQLYAWSSFVASIDEISAAQMLNFIAAETGGIMTWPAGNSAIAQGLYTYLVNTNGAQDFKAGCIVLQVKVVEGGVEILFEDEKRKVRKIFSKKCVMAAPKFVAKFILPDLPEDQRKAIDWISYRGYVVANVILNKKVEAPSFELYCIEGVTPASPRAMTPPDRHFTDICFGSWAQNDEVDHSVLTIYKALPMDGARQFLFSPFAHEKNMKAVQDGLPQILAGLGLKTDDVKGIRMTRWGHSIPVAKTGFIADGTPELISRPIADRIFFVNQDNWANPCFECAHQEAVRLKERI